MSYSYKFDDNSLKFKEESKEKKKKILYAIGLKWQSICSKLITTLGIVDSGRLRGSLTFITVDKVGIPIKRVKENKESDFLNGSSGDDSVLIVGSNVVYAKKQELFNKKGAFMTPALLEYRSSYKRIAKKIWEE